MLQVFGDFAGGGLHLAFGLVCALFEAQRSGKGQVVDAAMVDGVMSIFQVFYGMTRSGMHTGPVGTNLFDGGSPFYAVDESTLPHQYDESRWPEVRARLAEVFRTRTRDEWVTILEGTDACFAPVLDFAEAEQHPHNVARGSFVDVPGSMPQLLPVPRMSRTPGELRPTYAYPGCDTATVLSEFGFEPGEIDSLAGGGVIAW